MGICQLTPNYGLTDLGESYLLSHKSSLGGGGGGGGSMKELWLLEENKYEYKMVKHSLIRIKTESKKIVCCPRSIKVSLSMVCLGSRAITHQALQFQA